MVTRSQRYTAWLISFAIQQREAGTRQGLERLYELQLWARNARHLQLISQSQYDAVMAQASVPL